MKTISHHQKDELIIKKSHFIGYLFRIDDKENISDFLLQIKKQHSDATHICYAYILDNYIKAMDDGEPNKTAGMPILEILKKNNLNHVLMIVVRYFGGAKLGSNGLIRTYANITKKTLAKTSIKELIKGYLVKIVFNYKEEKDILSILDNSIIQSKEYHEEISYFANVTKETYDVLEKKYSAEIINEIYL